jgi:hypothetical protein
MAKKRFRQDEPIPAATGASFADATTGRESRAPKADFLEGSSMLSRFLGDETGAVTIDWVALTAGILLLGIAVVYGVFEGGVKPLTDEINRNLGIAVQVPDAVEAGPPDSFSGGGTGTTDGTGG